jgi:hypothetical protein
MKLADEAGTPILYTSGRHFEFKADALSHSPIRGVCGFRSGALTRRILPYWPDGRHQSTDL